MVTQLVTHDVGNFIQSLLLFDNGDSNKHAMIPQACEADISEWLRPAVRNLKYKVGEHVARGDGGLKTVISREWKIHF